LEYEQAKATVTTRCNYKCVLSLEEKNVPNQGTYVVSVASVGILKNTDTILYVINKYMENFLRVRAACGLLIHPSTGDARVLYVQQRITYCLRESFFNTIATCLA